MRTDMSLWYVYLSLYTVIYFRYIEVPVKRNGNKTLLLCCVTLGYLYLSLILPSKYNTKKLPAETRSMWQVTLLQASLLGYFTIAVVIWSTNGKWTSKFNGGFISYVPFSYLSSFVTFIYRYSFLKMAQCRMVVSYRRFGTNCPIFKGPVVFLG
jgi:hypothetical protein